MGATGIRGVGTLIPWLTISHPYDGPGISNLPDARAQPADSSPGFVISMQGGRYYGSPRICEDLRYAGERCGPYPHYLQHEFGEQMCDNAAAESFFVLLKRERVNRREYRTGARSENG
jgi:hypothetical protein